MTSLDLLTFSTYTFIILLNLNYHYGTLPTECTNCVTNKFPLQKFVIYSRFVYRYFIFICVVKLQ